MGLDLTYDADGIAFTHRFSHADWDTIDAIRTHLPNEVEICFDVPDLGEPVQIKKVALTQSALTIDRFLAEHANLLPGTYQFKVESFWGLPGMPAGGFDTGGMGGLRFPNDPDHDYTIHAGLNECTLTKRKSVPNADGIYEVVEKRDVRGETELITENCGKVHIRRRAAKTTLRRALREIAEFADRVTSAELTKIVG